MLTPEDVPRPAAASYTRDFASEMEKRSLKSDKHEQKKGKTIVFVSAKETIENSPL